MKNFVDGILDFDKKYVIQKMLTEFFAFYDVAEISEVVLQWTYIVSLRFRENIMRMIFSEIDNYELWKYQNHE